jgi:hypothetical protein
MVSLPTILPPRSAALREAILGYLKHAYYNAQTDRVALENGIIPNLNLALPTLENYTDDLIDAILASSPIDESEWASDPYKDGIRDWTYIFEMAKTQIPDAEVITVFPTERT